MERDGREWKGMEGSGREWKGVEGSENVGQVMLPSGSTGLLTTDDV